MSKLTAEKTYQIIQHLDEGDEAIAVKVGKDRLMNAAALINGTWIYILLEGATPGQRIQKGDVVVVEQVSLTGEKWADTTPTWPWDENNGKWHKRSILRLVTPKAEEGEVSFNGGDPSDIYMDKNRQMPEPATITGGTILKNDNVTSQRCRSCNGTGYINKFPQSDSNTPDCKDCEGSGVLTGEAPEPCPLCGWCLPGSQTCTVTASASTGGEGEHYEIVASKVLAIGARYAISKTPITGEEIKFAADLIKKYVSPQQAAPEGWVKVSERLPEDDSVHRILTYGWNDEYVAFYEGRRFYDLQHSDESGNHNDITEYITHWKYTSPPTD